ncbi:MAG: hypothetical protein KGJ77_04235 [Acidobacteriota bacterium]|nr:hypothetical protein [Acidobacteriota bacterium]
MTTSLEPGVGQVDLDLLAPALTDDAPLPASRPGGRHPALLLHLSVIAGFLLLAVLMWWKVWITGHPSSSMACQCADSSEELSYLAWGPWAVLHGHNPFFTNALQAGQGGANMLVNTTFLAGALLFAPVTLLWGPVATFNVLATLAPVVSAWCFFLAVRKVTRFVPGQLAAATLYGFSPMIVDSDPFGHFFQIWLFYPPLAFLCLYELFVGRRHPPARVGLALGLLTVVQFFVGTEVLAETLLIGVVGSVVAVALAPREAWRRARQAAVGLGVAGGIAAALLAYPAWYALAGPRHIAGAAWPLTTVFGSPPAAPIDPGAYRAVVGDGYIGASGPQWSYLGWGVLVFVMASVVVWRRLRLAWWAAAVGVVSWALSLGTVVIPQRPSTSGIWLPWRALDHLPIVSQIIPNRLASFTVLCAALLLALSADSWWRWATTPGPGPLAGLRARLRGARSVVGLGLSALAVVALVPVAVTYSFPFRLHKLPTPRWFTTVAPRLPAGTELLVYPYPDGFVTQAMGWQAMDAFRFRLLGGFLIVPGADGHHSSGVSPFGGSRLLLDQLTIPGYGRLPAATHGAVAQLRSDLTRWGVQDVVMTRQGRSAAYALAFFTDTFGRMPRLQADSWVWYGLGKDPPLGVAPRVVQRCAKPGLHTWDRPTIPRCVLRAAGAGG